MGKRKIGEIYNKPIIEGDINLKTSNEIHKSELSGGGNTPTTTQHPFEERYYFDISSFSKDEKVVVLDIILELMPMESNASIFNFIAKIDLGDNVIVYDTGINFIDHNFIPYFNQISFNKTVIYGWFGSGFNPETFRTVDSIQVLYATTGIVDPQYLSIITKITNNRITADEFWAEVPPFEELN